MKINTKTKTYCLIGSPVAHSLSPDMHNAAFRRLKINAIYIKFEVPSVSIDKGIRMLKDLKISGANVTIPHKETCIRHLNTISKEAKLIGAVNTIVNKNGRLKGFNTDAIGFLTALKQDLDITPKGKKVFLLGAGGASKAVATALAMKGADSIFIADVARKKAAQLARRLKKNFPKCDIKTVFKDKGSYIKECDLLINATPVGMKAKDPLLVNPKYLHRGLKVYDLVYNVPATKLVKTARRKGLKASCGLNMLLYQGAESFRLWTKRKPPISVMRRALKK